MLYLIFLSVSKDTFTTRATTLHTREILSRSDARHINHVHSDIHVMAQN